MWPEFSIGPLQNIPTYFPLLSLLYTGLLIYTVHKSEKESKDRDLTLSLSMILMVSGFLGARLFHIFYESPQYYIENPVRALAFWEGGFVYFGGFIFCLAFSWLYLKKQKQDFLSWADFFTPIFALGYGLGRLTCFFSGCCYGKFCEFPWAVTFAWESQALPRHPTQLYAMFWELLLFAFLVSIKRKLLPKGLLFFTWLTGHSVGRMIMEVYRDDFRGQLIAGQSVSTWISVILFLFGITGLFLCLRKTHLVK